MIATKQRGINEYLALVFCIEYIYANIDWLIEKLSQFNEYYVLFDCPGQVELFTHHDSLRKLVHQLQDDHSYRLTAVHLVDSFYCSQPTTFISILLTSLSTMLKLELSHVNVLSKIDAVLSRGDLGMPNVCCFHFIDKLHHIDFNLEFYTDVLDLSHLLELLDNVNFLR